MGKGLIALHRLRLTFEQEATYLLTLYFVSALVKQTKPIKSYFWLLQWILEPEVYFETPT